MGKLVMLTVPLVFGTEMMNGLRQPSSGRLTV
jgi:hypothetical protein